LSLLGLFAALPTIGAVCPLGHGAPDSHSLRSVFDQNVEGGDDYQNLSAQDKFNQIRASLNGTPKSGSWPNVVEMAGLFTESMSVSMDNCADTFPTSFLFQRMKLIHSVGYTAAVKINWLPNPYTGLFQQADLGYLRMASAVEPDYTKASATDGSFTPGFGLKFLRDGVHSGNAVFLHTLMPWDSYNAFKYPYSNHLSTAGLGSSQQLLADKFSTAPSDWAGYVGLNDFAGYTQSGAHVGAADLHFPFQLIMQPDAGLQTKFPDTGAGHDLFSTQLQGLPVGQHLFAVYAKASYKAAAVHIGDIVMASTFAPSGWGDNKMFVQHTRFDDDIKLRASDPTFMDGCASLTTCKVCPVEVAC